jgi:cytochrome P450
MHRNNTALYGQDASSFRPERWFVDEIEPERYAKMIKTNDMIFGYGRWVCLGRNIALIEIHKVVFELFRYFDFSLSDPAVPWKTFNSLGLWEISDLWVDVTVRE